jgi:hypothetical protein
VPCFYWLQKDGGTPPKTILMNNSYFQIQPEVVSDGPIVGRRGTHDGDGAGDHDQPFSGYRPYHFPTAQLVRLLLLRSEILDSRMGLGRYSPDLESD